MNPLGGILITIIEDIHLVDVKEDWSQVRSPGRARRRRKRGFPQRIRIFHVAKPTIFKVGNAYIAHPETAAKFRAELRAATIRS